MVATRGTTTITTPTGQAPVPAPATAAATSQAGPGGGGGVAPGGGPGIPGIPFALVPSQTTHDVIDYCTREGQSLFRSSTQNLYSEPSEMFECDPDGLINFIPTVK